MLFDIPLLEPGNPLAEPILLGIQREQLLMQRCGSCDSYQYPPRPVCRRCSAFELSFRRVSGFGKIVEVSTRIGVNDPFVELAGPFLLAAIQLEEDERLVIPSKLVGPSSPAEAPPGTGVIAEFERTSSGQFRLVFHPNSTP